jgi:hypothetical protein
MERIKRWRLHSFIFFRVGVEDWQKNESVQCALTKKIKTEALATCRVGLGSRLSLKRFVQSDQGLSLQVVNTISANKYFMANKTILSKVCLLASYQDCSP